MRHYDICIIGAGPAGISIACKLNQLGYDCLLITEKAGTRRPMLQSLSPGIFTLLDTIGLGSDPLSMGCRKQDQMIQHWTDEIIQSPDPHGYLADRREFDSCLFRKAKKSGIKVFQAKVTGLKKTNSWEIRIFKGGNYSSITCKFLVDASGKRSILQGKKVRVGASSLAISGTWKKTTFPKNSTILESAKNNWLWGARQEDSIFHLTVFLDPAIRKIKNLTLKKHYLSAIEHSTLFNGCLKGSLVGELTTYDTTPYYYKEPAATDFMKVGEANLSLDPISSQGVQTAISNAIQGAIVINTIFSDPGNAKHALDFYETRQQETIKNHLQLASKHYHSVNRFQKQLFWTKRAKKAQQPDHATIDAFDDSLGTAKVQFSTASRFIPTPCIIKDLVDTRMGLHHPALARPVVFRENKEINRILGSLDGVHEPGELISRWSRHIPHASSVKLFQWLRQAGILEAVPQKSKEHNNRMKGRAMAKETNSSVFNKTP